VPAWQKIIGTTEEINHFFFFENLEKMSKNLAHFFPETWQGTSAVWWQVVPPAPKCLDLFGKKRSGSKQRSSLEECNEERREMCTLMVH
jgi:hypothetical protein